MDFLDREFQHLPDHRAGNAVRYILADVVKSAFAMFSLKAPWRQNVLVSIDGVEHFSSTKVHCPSCLTCRRSNGEISYHHAGLAAVLIDPDRREVFPLDFEPILREDGAEKNDCERNM